MRRTLKTIGCIILVPISLFVILAALLYVPPVQNWAVRKAARMASETTGMEISVSHVRLSFPLDLAVDGVTVLQPNDSLPQVKDTIADIRSTIVEIRLLPLLTGNVEVDKLEILSARFNTDGLVAAARVKGEAEKLFLASHGIDLLNGSVTLNSVLLERAKVDVQLSDTVPEDTTESENQWKIHLESLQISRSDITLHMPGDTLRVGVHLADAKATDGHFDLHEGIYQVGGIDLKGGRLAYDNRFEPTVAGFDYNHLALDNVNIAVDSISYHAPDMYLNIRSAAFRESNGLELKQLAGAVRMDSIALHIPGLTAETANSRLCMSAEMDLNVFDETNPGSLSLKASAGLGKGDLMLFMADMPEAFRTAWPQYPLAVEADISGTMQHLSINTLSVDLPTAFTAEASGHMANVTDTDKLLASLDINAQAYDLGFATSALLDSDMQNTVRIPSGIRLTGNVNADGAVYSADLRATQGDGWATLKGSCDTGVMAYSAELDAHSFPLRNFLVDMDVTPLTASVSLSGCGTDIYSKQTKLDADARIDQFSYGNFDLDGATATARIADGMVCANMSCANSLVSGDISLDALMSKSDIKATLGCSLDKMDFHGLNVTPSPLTASLCAHVDIESDLDEFFKVQGFVSDVAIQDSASLYRPDDLEIDALTRQDTTRVELSSGDFSLDLAASGGYKRLLRLSETMTQELQKQIDRKCISQDSLQRVLPVGHLKMRSGRSNFVYGTASRLGYHFRKINADLTSSPAEGLNGYLQVDSLVAYDIQIDKARLEVVTVGDVFEYHIQVKNEKDNPDYCFNALIDGSLFETGSNVSLAFYDANDSLGIRMGLRGALEPEGIRIALTDPTIILGYTEFAANADNYIMLGDNNRVSANMRLTASDGRGFYILSNDEDEDVLQDITLGINKLDLAEISAVIPYMPDIGGTLDGDFHVIQTETELSVSSSLGVAGLAYEGSEMGDMSTDFVYMPLEDGGHYVDGMLMKDDQEIGTLKGTYNADGHLDADMSLSRLPLSLANGFIPDQLIGLRGYGDGELKLRGTLDAMQMNGTIDLDSAYLFSIPYGVEMRFDNRAVRIEDSKLLLDDFNMYANNEQPLVINGNVDFSNLDNMTVNMRMSAQNFLVIDAKENRKSEVFGKTYVNFNAMLSGPVAAMQIRGKLDVLGSTDMTYIMRDTPLTTDNTLDELVKFTDFSSDEEEVITLPPVEGLNMDLSVSIDQGAHVFCALNATKTNYLDITGGGDLRLIYSSDEMRLTGRYTLNDGEMKYSLPVIPLKTFTIQEGSYVEFTGEVMNPTLNITATEENKTNVTSNGSTRSVTFNCGVVVTQTLNNMGLQFIIEAPEDMTITNELETKSVEERGKLAVTMLTTGMYLSDDNLSSFTMNDALSSFLQNEINSISNNALRTLDISIGLDNTADAAGQMHTDYTFKFAKRLWNNRVRIVVGGKVSSDQAGADNIFDNVALEYRLDQSANTNLRVFYDHAVYDYLEGYVGQYGVGISWSRKLQDLRQLFKWNSTPTNGAPETKEDEGGNDESEQ